MGILDLPKDVFLLHHLFLKFFFSVLLHLIKVNLHLVEIFEMLGFKCLEFFDELLRLL